MDGADIRMIQRRRRLRFALKTGKRYWVTGDRLGQKLERNKTVQSYIFGFIHYTHPAATEFLDNLVVRNGPSDHVENPTLTRTASQ